MMWNFEKFVNFLNQRPPICCFGISSTTYVCSQKFHSRNVEPNWHYQNRARQHCCLQNERVMEHFQIDVKIALSGPSFFSLWASVPQYLIYVLLKIRKEAHRHSWNQWNGNVPCAAMYAFCICATEAFCIIDLLWHDSLRDFLCVGEYKLRGFRFLCLFQIGNKAVGFRLFGCG